MPIKMCTWCWMVCVMPLIVATSIFMQGCATSTAVVSSAELDQVIQELGPIRRTRLATLRAEIDELPTSTEEERVILYSQAVWDSFYLHIDRQLIGNSGVFTIARLDLCSWRARLIPHTVAYIGVLQEHQDFLSPQANVTVSDITRLWRLGVGASESACNTEVIEDFTTAELLNLVKVGVSIGMLLL